MSLSCLNLCAKELSPAASLPPHPTRRKSAASPKTAQTDRMEAPKARNKPRVALLLNARARSVTPAAAHRLEKIVGKQNAFYSHSLDEARSHIAHIANQGYDTLVCCGGDGTLVTAVNMMRDYIVGQHRDLHMPRFAQLTLGTGNALRQVIGAGDPDRDLRRIQAGKSTERPLSLIEDHQGTAFFFAGIGHDALLMHDYDRMQHAVPGCLSRHVLRSKFGFTTALLARTMPHTAQRRNHGHATVTAQGPCFRIDREHGDAWVPLRPGEIFSGPVGMLGVSTVPWLGYDIRMFPFADATPALMHLRISQISLFGMMYNGRSLWAGTFKHPTLCHDFLVTGVDIKLDRPLHYQHSGEPQGRVDHVQFGIRPQAVTLAAQNAPNLQPSSRGPA